jgi:hypothetical protein
MELLPTTSIGIGRWSICLIAVYVSARLKLAQRRHRPEDGIGIVGDAATFSTSVLLLLGVWFPGTVLRAIGDTSLFLIFAGMAGLLSSIKAALKQS